MGFKETYCVYVKVVHILAAVCWAWSSNT